MLNLNPTLTTAGVALFTGQVPGFAVAITHIAFGSQKYNPQGTETALRSEFARYPIDGGVKMSPSALQVGVLMTSADPNGRSSNDQWVGEIGFYSGNTLFAVLSHAAAPLFYKSPDIDIPVTYVLDYSALPPGSITVNNDAQAENIALASSYAQTAADVAQTAAAAIKSSYYGASSVAPMTRPDGTARQKGDRYYDTVEGAEKTFTGVNWYIPNIDSAALATLLGAGMAGFDPSKEYQPKTVGTALRGAINVLTYLSPAQIANAYLRLGTINCGPQLQQAINDCANGRLIWPAGYVFGSAQELIVRTAQVWEGGGKGNMLYPFSRENVPGTVLQTIGDGTAYKTVKTRVLYRGSAADPQDAPLSALVNIQHQGVEIRDMVIRCSYDENKIWTTPNYLGDDWDVGIFVGCRIHCKIKDTAVVGCWRDTAIRCDVTRGLGLPELFGWDGIQHPVDYQYGGDGCTMSEVITWGGKWGVLVKGAEPKPGLISYGKDYTRSVAITFAALPVDGDKLTCGEIAFTFRDDPAADTDVQIEATAALTAQNFVDVVNAIIAASEDYPKLRSATYVLDNNIVRTFERDSNDTVYNTTFTASVAADGRLTLSSTTPATVPDPAPYYDAGLGATAADGRGSYGFSDFTIRDSQIFGSNSPTKYARTLMRADKNYLIDTAGGSFYIDGLAGNASRELQGHRYFNVRFDGKYDPFNVRLGRTHRDEFFACHWDGTGVNGFYRPDGTSVGTNMSTIKYGPTTRTKLTRRTRFYSRDSTPYGQYCPMDDVGSGNVSDGSGRNESTGNMLIRRGNVTLDKSITAVGAAVYTAKGGATGSGRYDFRSPAGVRGGLRYYYGSDNLRLACSGNLNAALWARDAVANTATQYLTPNDSAGQGIYASEGSVLLMANKGEAEIRSGAGSLVRFKSDNSTLGAWSTSALTYSGNGNLVSTGYMSVRAPSTVTLESTGGAVMLVGVPVAADGEVYLRVKNGVSSRLRMSDVELVPYMSIRPSVDNVYTLGATGQRWSVVYSGTAAINTSDARLKEQRAGGIDPAVLRAWGKVEYAQYKFTDAIEKKGDGARWHFGVIAQQVKEAFESEGLDAFAYGLLCYDEWEAKPAIVSEGKPATFDESGAEIAPAEEPVEIDPAEPAGNCYGIRYEEAFALEMALSRQQMAAMQAKLAALA